MIYNDMFNVTLIQENVLMVYPDAMLPRWCKVTVVRGMNPGHLDAWS